MKIKLFPSVNSSSSRRFGFGFRNRLIINILRSLELFGTRIGYKVVIVHEQLRSCSMIMSGICALLWDEDISREECIRWRDFIAREYRECKNRCVKQNQNRQAKKKSIFDISKGSTKK